MRDPSRQKVHPFTWISRFCSIIPIKSFKATLGNSVKSPGRWNWRAGFFSGRQMVRTKYRQLRVEISRNRRIKQQSKRCFWKLPNIFPAHANTTDYSGNATIQAGPNPRLLVVGNKNRRNRYRILKPGEQWQPREQKEIKHTNYITTLIFAQHEK
jgi:hypothetical protein